MVGNIISMKVLGKKKWKESIIFGFIALIVSTGISTVLSMFIDTIYMPLIWIVCIIAIGYIAKNYFEIKTWKQVALILGAGVIIDTIVFLVLVALFGATLITLFGFSITKLSLIV